MSKPRLYPPTYLLIFLLAAIALHFLLPLARIIPSPWNAFGVIFLAAGVVINVQADGLFRRQGTTVNPDGEPSMLVTQGFFRYGRNPMYFGFALTLFGTAFLFGTLSPFLTVPAFVFLIERRFILVEEKNLATKFGPVYLEYKRSVRRWI
jgi:protein-S-isoprenylcysteine O-methyltransferase Ste14